MRPNVALKQIIDTKGLKRVDIAKSSGVSPNDLTAYLNGRRDLMGDRLIAVVRSLPVDAQATFWILMGRPDDPEEELAVMAS
jgi:transcriptional regulator with XRE-family HTH domain